MVFSVMLGCHRPVPPPALEWQDAMMRRPECPLASESDDGADVGVSPEAVVLRLRSDRVGRIRFGAEPGDEQRASLHAVFTPETTELGRTAAADPRFDWDRIAYDGPRTCASGVATLEVRGAWEVELRSHGRWIAAATLGLRVMVQSPDPDDWFVFTDPRGVRATVPPWPARQLDLGSPAVQVLRGSGTWSDLGLSGVVEGSTGRWTFTAEP